MIHWLMINTYTEYIPHLEALKPLHALKRENIYRSTVYKTFDTGSLGLSTQKKLR